MEEHQTRKVGDGDRQILRNKKYAPATGIQSDFEKVLTTFVETKSIRYEDFAKIWREKKMSFICAGRQTDRETVEFMEECMKVAVKMFLPPYGFQARVGALYLLYGLYLTQPCLPKVKIRVTREDWEHVKSLQDEFIRQSHHDTNFILQKLMLDGAFYFCALSQEARSRYSQSEETIRGMAESLKEDKQRIDSLFSEEILEQLNLIHNRYHKQKVRVAGPDASRPDRSLDVLHDKFPTTVQNSMKDHHDRWKSKEAQRQGRHRSLPTIPESGESEAESDADYQPATSVGQRRARLKTMAFSGVKNKQRYKHRAVERESSSSDKGSPSPKKKRGRPRGSTNKSSIQRATMDTISEQEEDSTVDTESNVLLSMPQFDDFQTEEKRPGRKRKSRENSSSSPAKKHKFSDAEKSMDLTDDEEQSAAFKSPTKRTRGRPPKPKPGSSKQRRPVGRPRKEQASSSSEVKKPTSKREEKKTKKKKPKNKSENKEAEMGDQVTDNQEEEEEGDLQTVPSPGEGSHTTSPHPPANSEASELDQSIGEEPQLSPSRQQSASGKVGRKRVDSGDERGEGVTKLPKKTAKKGKAAKVRIIPLSVSAKKGKKKT